MPNGRPGDHPLTDTFVHGQRVFPEEIDRLLRKLAAIAPKALRNKTGERCWELADTELEQILYSVLPGPGYKPENVPKLAALLRERIAAALEA